MNNLRICFVYLVVYSILATILRINITPFDRSLIGPFLDVTLVGLVVCSLKQIMSFKYRNVLFFYIILICFIELILQKHSPSYASQWFAPFIVCASIDSKDTQCFKPIGYILIVVFISNAIAALYERITLDYILEFNTNSDVMVGQSVAGNVNEFGFRAFAFFGHPLTNANIMACFIFIILYSHLFSYWIRFICAVLGILSLFCFNARGAQIVSAILLLPSIFIYYKRIDKFRFLYLLCIFFSVYFVITNFLMLGGRFADKGIVDDSAMVRVLCFQEFVSLPFTTLLMGGYETKYGENGYIMEIEYFGLLIGGVKILLELFFSFKFLKKIPDIHKWIIIFSLVLVGNTNNSLFFPYVFPIFILGITFLCYNSFYFSIFDKDIS